MAGAKGPSSKLRSRIARAASRVRPGPRPGWEFRDKRSSRRFVAWASTSTGSGTRNFRLLESQLFRSTLQAVGGQDDSSFISVYKKYRPSHFSRCDCLLPGIQPAQNQQMPNFGSEIRPTSRNGSNKLGQALQLL